MTLPSFLQQLAALAVVSAVVPGAMAQCTPQWQPGDPLPHVHGSVNAAVTWDPDGAGPLGLQLVVGGKFQAGDMASTRIAAFDGSQWLPLGSPPGADVTALAVYNGQLVAASYGAVSYLSIWTGTTWQPLGVYGQALGSVRALTVFNGDLIAAGAFSALDGVTTNGIARWNGAAWSALGSGVTGTVHALAVFSNVLQVGGAITSAGGVPVANHAIWNGSSWVAGASFNGPVETLATRYGTSLLSSYLFAGGAFTSLSAAGSGTVAAQHVARQNASSAVWSAMASGLAGTTCKRLCTIAVGVNGYELTAATDDAPYCAWRWTGTAWTALGYVDDPVLPIVPTALLYHAGRYVLALQSADVAVRTYDSVAGWVPVRGRGVDDRVYACCAAGGEVVLGGAFRSISGVAVHGIARGVPGAWQPLGAGLEGGFGVFAVAALPNGDIVAGGNFTTAGGAPANHIARWNGSSWSPLGSGCDDSVNALAVLPNGDLVAGGAFVFAGGAPVNRIARWNGVTWSPLGSGSPSPVNALEVLPNGDLIVGGNFVSIGGVAASRIARWNGSAWSALGAGVDNAVWDVAALPNGDLIVGGHFTTAGGVAAPYIARWNGSAWSAVGIPFGLRPTSDVYTLAVLPDGDLVAGGGEWTFDLSFPPVHVQSNLARLDSANDNWGGLDVHGLLVQTSAFLPDGDLVVGGGFGLAGGVSVGNVARLAPPCRAQATTFAPGCPGSGGGNTLVATSLPWADSTFRATGTGLPVTAAVFAVTSFTALLPPFPLAAVFAEAVPGCNLHVAPDILQGIVTADGTARSSLSLPNTPPLVGLTFYHQMVPIELGPLGQFVAMTSTNALQLTVGIF